MAINDRDFYASHGISFDVEEMQIEYTKRVIKQAKIEALTEIQLEIEDRRTDYDKGSKAEHDIYCAYDKCSRIIQQKINALKADKEQNNEKD